MKNELMALNAVKETGDTLTSVAGAIKGTSEIVSYFRENKLHSQLSKIEEGTIIAIAKTNAGRLEAEHDIRCAASVYATVGRCDPRYQDELRVLADNFRDQLLTKRNRRNR